MPLSRDDIRKQVVKKFLRFAIIGVLNTLVHASVLVSLVQIWKLGSGVSNVVAYLVASTISFLLNAQFAFRVRRTSMRFMRFQMVGLLNVAVCYGLGELADAQGLHYAWLVLITGLILPLISFALHYKFSFV